ncbi:MAG: ABC transporter permease [Bacteroidales bacterium]|jgi:putative ABC transport system permease protein|nr:ABC transporter permease [Bacteroidales bacterium]
MLEKNIKLAFRIFTKNKHYFFLNLINLTVGIICGIIILFYLQNFKSFDKHHVKHSKIYRVGYDFTTSSGRSMKKASSSEKIGPMLKDECPEIESYVRFRPMDQVVVKYDDKSFVENDILYVDTSIFTVFTHKFIEGNANTCLENKNSIVLVNSMAKKYFGSNSAVGKTLKIDSVNYQVTGVIKDLPDNIHLKFDALVNYQNLGFGWFTTTCYTYLFLNENAKVDGIYDKYPQLFDKYMLKESQSIKATIDIILEPLVDIHFNSDLPQDFPQGNKMYVYILGIVGLFIVIISSINYINMSTAFSTNRTKEIGLKKIFGSSQITLRAYFIIESLLLTLIAFLISIVFVRLIVDANYLHQILNAKLQFKFIENINLLLMSFILALIVGLISGLYPAFYLSSIPPISAVSSSFKHKKGNAILRKALIVFQFVLSVCVLIGVLAMNKQINFINNKDLGFNKDKLITIPLANTDNSTLSILKEELCENPSIISVSTAYILPNSQEMMCNFSIETESGTEEQLFNWLIVDHDYIKTMEIQVLEGRDFDKNIISDVNKAYIVNESFLKHMCWEHAVNKRMQIINGGYFNWPKGEIIGVVKDFNISSLHKKIEPIIIVLYSGGYLHLRISGANIAKTLEDIGLVCTKIAPSISFEYSFMDEQILQSYSNEMNQFILVKLFSIICFILSCLGLIGLSAYSIAQRTKEVAIRKQLGATVINIIIVLFKDIAFLILIAILIAIPLSYWAVNLWLESFAYRIHLGIWIFITSGFIAFLIGFLSVLYYSLKAAYINPVEALKYE